MSVELLTAWSIALALFYLFAVALTVVVAAVRLGGRREAPPADHDAMSASRFTIPVSLVVPVDASADGTEVDRTIDALLALNYPQLEVIVIANSLSASDPLNAGWWLEARELFYRAALPTAPVRMMYRSARDSRLLVVHKTPGTMADALNCGVNLARFRYVVAVEPGVTFDVDALLRAVTAPLRDPAAVVGATSHIEVTGATLQRLRSIRSLMHSRVIWRGSGPALGPCDAVVVWRRDAVAQAGGFSSNAADPHLDMMVRLQTSAAPGARGLVVRTTEIFGQRSARSMVDHVRRTARWQVAALQAVASLVAAGPNTRVMLGSFFVAEVLTPCVQAWAIIATAAGAAAGYWPWIDVVRAAVLLALGQAIVTCAALLVRGSVSHAPDARGLQRLLLLAPLEGFAITAAAACARAAGFCAFVVSPRSRRAVDERAPSPAA